MKCSLQWLKEWVHWNGEVGELCERLTMLGLEIDKAERPACEMHQVSVARVFSIKSHPQDRSWKICEVWVFEDGEERLRTLATSDLNLVVGSMVAYVPSRDLLPFQCRVPPPPL